MTKLDIWDDRALLAAEAAVAMARTVLATAEVAAGNARRAYWRDKYGIAPGVVVKDINGLLGTVSVVEDKGYGATTTPPWVMVYRHKKDGSVGNGVVRFFDWEIVT